MDFFLIWAADTLLLLQYTVLVLWYCTVPGTEDDQQHHEQQVQIQQWYVVQ